MNQKSNNNNLEEGSSSTIVSVTSGVRPKFRRKLIVSFMCLLLVAASVTYLYAKHSLDVNNGEKINKAKILALDRASNCSDKALNDVSKEKPDVQDPSGSILLL